MMDILSDGFSYEFPEMNPRRRMWELILYIAKASIYDGKFGKTKLYKILFNSDFTSFRLRGTPVTGAQYVRLLNGPIPDNIEALLAEMEAGGAIEYEYRPIPGKSKPQTRVIAKHEPDYETFSAQDIAIVEEVIRDLGNSSGTDAAAETHGIVYNALRMREPIPYEASSISDDPVTEEDLAEAQELIEKYGWGI